MPQHDSSRVVRVDVLPRAGGDPLADALREQGQSIGVAIPDATSRRIYLLETPEPDDRLRELAVPLLADGVAESGELHATAFEATGSWIEVLPRPGVTDPAAASAQAALRARGLDVSAVQTGRAYAIEGELPDDDRDRLASLLANGVVEEVHFAPHLPTSFPRGDERPFQLRHAELLHLDDAGLERLSREGHLFLSLTEMRAVQHYFQQRYREPTDAELETIAQTWSEHCVHKTLKSKVVVEDERGVELRRYGNLIKETIFASTQEIMRRRGDDFCLSVFVDNAGVIAFDDADGVCFKVETHNRPSAIEPYGGAATGIGGVIRDVLGTGLGAKPIACTDVFCVAWGGEMGAGEVGRGQKPDTSESDLGPHPTSPAPTSSPAGVIPPARVLDGIVGGVRDYGNRMGIPTVNGAIVYHEDYVANPLVFCGCVGVLPRGKIDKAARVGDRIVVMGGRTGRDGIHGATFSSAELTDTHGDEFSHAVQIGNPITEKIVADVLLQARDLGLFTAVTDCGAGGLSSAIGEMGEDVGASVELDKVPLKYAGLRYDEVWISEAQERMVLSVPPDKLADLLDLCEQEDVEATDIGHFGHSPTHGHGGPELRLRWNGTTVAELSMAFLHDGIPMPERKAVVEVSGESFQPASDSDSDRLEALATQLVGKLSSANIASKHRVVRQYDTEVLGGTVVKPFVGPMQIGPADAAVVRPKLGSNKAVAIGCGLAPHIDDPYAMSIAAIDEAIRNVVCVGADFERIALLDNFCWPGTDNAETLGTLVRSCEACRDAALAFGTPFVSGKDSLHNQFTDKRTGRTIRIPRTLLISAIGIVEDARRCVTSDLKRAGDELWLVSSAGNTLPDRRAAHVAVASLVASGNVTAAHDVSDGGWLVAVAEMCIGGHLGATLETTANAFAEPLTTYVLSGRSLSFPDVLRTERLGSITSDPTLLFDENRISVEALRRAWRRE